MGRLAICSGGLIFLGVLAGCASGSSSMVNATLPTTTATLSATSYDFGQNIVGNPDTQTVVEVTNTGTHPLTLNPAVLNSTGGFAIVAGQSCGTTLAPASTCPSLSPILRPRQDRNPQP